MTASELTPGPAEVPRSPLVRLRKALGRVRRSVTLDVYDFFVCRWSDHADGLAAIQPPDGYAIRFANADEIAAAQEVHTDLDEREREEGIVRLGFGHRCISVFSGELLVFSMWENPRNVNVPGLLKHQLAPDQSFLYKAYTSPEHRGRRLYQAGLAFALRSIAQEGKAETVGYAHVKKKASRAGLARVGFHDVGRVRQLLAPGLRRTWLDAAFRATFPREVDRTDAVAHQLSGEGPSSA